MSVTQRTKFTTRVAVDLTPLLPGGDNGGAKIMTIELLKQICLLANDWEFILLTSDISNDELAILDSHNVRRVCIRHRSVTSSSSALFPRIRAHIKEWLKYVLPRPVKLRLSYVFNKTVRQVGNRGILKGLGADLLFCPFTAPFLYDPSVQIVSVVYDLQYRDYPQYFDPVDRYHRHKNFMEACSKANRIICISDFVRDTVISYGGVSPERVKSIYIQLPHRLGACQPASAAQTLFRFHIKDKSFILYPANFWPHKNHTLLLTAYGIYLANNPKSTLKLVCTGSPGERMEYLLTASKRMGLSEHVIYTGYLSDTELSGLMASCLAVIFPSLYEGFGMPVIEAMAFGKPVLCSNVTSLPEITGGAAFLFDPRRPEQIAGAIARIQEDPALVRRLDAQGRERANNFGGPVEMASQYLQTFRDAISQPGQLTQGLYGVYPDGWTGDLMQVAYDLSVEERYLEINLSLPAWSPTSRVNVTAVCKNINTTSARYLVKRKENTCIRLPLSNKGGLVEFSLNPTFQPQINGLGPDTRMLGCQCQSCSLVSASETKNLLGSGVDQTWQSLSQ
ncbi:MAG: glycosyltransferase family 4 protein [Sulfuricaulis sp.]